MSAPTFLPLHGEADYGRADNTDSELNETSKLKDRAMLNSTGIAQAVEEGTPTFSPSTLPPLAICDSSGSILCGESPGFLDNPVYPLNSATHGQAIPLFYNVTMKEAPIFSNNPTCQLNDVAPGQMLPSLCDANTTETALIYPPNYIVPGQTLPSYHNATNAEAPSFMAKLYSQPGISTQQLRVLAGNAYTLQSF